MRIVIDARMYGPERWTGIGRYLQFILAELERLDHDNDYTVLLGRDNFEHYQPRARNFRKLLAPHRPYSLGEQLGLARLLYQLKPDLVHFAAPNAPLFYWGRHITTVHDLTLIFFSTSRGTGLERLRREAKRIPFRLVMWWMAHGSQLVLTPTEFVREQLRRRYHLAARRVRATALGIDPTLAQPEPIAHYGVGDDYVLYVGNCYPYKNVGRLLEAFRLVAARQPHLKLVLVGRDDYFRLQLKQRAQEWGLADRVVFTGAVSDGELVSLYQQARLYVYPSLSEGFGLQGLEAMAQGVPVLAANASCLPEVCGPAAVYFDPYDVRGLAEKITDLLANDQLREQMRAAGRQRVQQFDWRTTAELTLEAYRSALKKRA